jgi:hypothetical protein
MLGSDLPSDSAETFRLDSYVGGYILQGDILKDIRIRFHEFEVAFFCTEQYHVTCTFLIVDQGLL